MSGGQTSTGRRFSLIASVFGILALGRFLSFQPRSYAWRIAWLNMIGSNLFMISALASYVLPSTGEFINSLDRRHATRRGLLRGGSDLDVAGMEACGSSSTTRAP